MPELPDSSLEADGKLGRSWFPGPPPAEFDKTRNMRFLGFSGRPANAFAEFNSDIAFQGRYAYQGTFEGFRILNVRNPVNPQEIINYEDCKHPSGQGDVVIYGDVLTRSWDSAGHDRHAVAGGLDLRRHARARGHAGAARVRPARPDGPEGRGVHPAPVRLAHRDRRAGPAQRSRPACSASAATGPRTTTTG